MIFRNSRMIGMLKEVGEAYTTRPAAELYELNFIGQPGIQEEMELE